MSEEIEEVEIIDVREEQVKELIRQFMAGEKHLSFSSLKAFAESPADFIQYQLRERKTTPAMIWGSLIHCLILEPENFQNVYVVMDDKAKCEEIGGKSPRQTNLYKEWKANFLLKHEGKIVIGIDMITRAAAVANNVLFNRAARPLLDACTEREVYTEWEYKNLKFRGFIDAKTPEGAPKKIKIDIKTCKDANPAKFAREIMSNKHYLQGTMYDVSDPGVEHCTYYVIAVDQKGGVSVHRIDPPLLEYGLKEYDRLVTAFNKCLIKDSFNQSYDFWADGASGTFVCQLPSYLG